MITMKRRRRAGKRSAIYLTELFSLLIHYTVQVKSSCLLFSSVNIGYCLISIMITTFEQFPNELILICFSYFNFYELYESLRRLNLLDKISTKDKRNVDNTIQSKNKN